MSQSKSKRLGRRTLMVAAISTLLVAFVPTVASASEWFGGGSASGLPTVVGVGDSFTSGEGNPPFVPGTDTATDKCHRSYFAYPQITALLVGARARNVACSGAQTKDLFTTYQSEPAQLSRLGNASDIVTTIGGNDIHALDLIAHPPTPEALSAALQALEPVLVATYESLHAADPNARVFAVGYPSLVGQSAVSGCPLSTQQRAAAIAGAQALDATIQLAAMQAGVTYVDTFDAFAGHELCTTSPWVHGIDSIHPEYSLHPNVSGQWAIAQRVAAAIRVHDVRI